MTTQQIMALYQSRMNRILEKKRKEDQDIEEKRQERLYNQQQKNAKLSTLLSSAKMYKDLYEGRQSKLLDIVFGGTDKDGLQERKYQFKQDRTFKDFLENPFKETVESVKRLTPKGALEETDKYKEFKLETQKEEFKKDALSWSDDVKRLEESRGETEDIVPLADEFAADEPIDYERLEQEEDVWSPIMKPDDPDYEKIRSDLERQTITPKVSEDEWLQGIDPATGRPRVELYSGSGASQTAQQVTRYNQILSENPSIAKQDAWKMAQGEYIEKADDDILPPIRKPEYSRSQLEGIQEGADIAQDQQLRDLRELQTGTGVAPGTARDADLEGALQEMENLKAPKVKGSGEVAADQMIASSGSATDAPLDVSGEEMDSTGGGKTFGKTFQALQKGQQLFNIGKTLADENVSEVDKLASGTQGVKMLADLAIKKSGQKTGEELGRQAVKKYLSGKGLEQGVKLGAKQAVGVAAGGLMGGYTAVSEAKAAADSWEEGDYDEAILQGIGSVGGGLQTAGAGMMLSGVGAPIGMVMYGVGAAASGISAAGQFIEGLFGGSSKPKSKPKEEPKMKIDRSRLFR